MSADDFPDRDLVCRRMIVEAEARSRYHEILASRIARVLIDSIVRDVIRPGFPEVRECVEVGDELRQYLPEMVRTIALQLASIQGCL